MKPSAPAPAIRPRHDSTLAEIDALEDRLYEHNRAATGRDDGAGLGFVVVKALGGEDFGAALSRKPPTDFAAVMARMRRIRTRIAEYHSVD